MHVQQNWVTAYYLTVLKIHFLRNVVYGNMCGIPNNTGYWGTTEKPEMDLLAPTLHISVSHTSPSSDIAAKDHPTDWLSVMVHEHQLSASFRYSDLDL